MPHFGLIDEDNMTEEDMLLMRARLHLRSGRRRLREGKLTDAVAVLFDAVFSGMQWAALTSEWWTGEEAARKDQILCDETGLYELLKQRGLWNRSLDFHHFHEMVDQAMQGRVAGFDRQDLVERIEALMTTLGVMPFDEDNLPPESPDAF